MLIEQQGYQAHCIPHLLTLPWSWVGKERHASTAVGNILCPCSGTFVLPSGLALELVKIRITPGCSDLKHFSLFPSSHNGDFLYVQRVHRWCFSWNMDCFWLCVKICCHMVRNRIFTGKLGTQSQYKYALTK